MKFIDLFVRNGKLRVFVVPMLLIALLLSMAGCGVASLLSSFRYSKTNLDKEDLGIKNELHMNAPKGITNIALFGIDARQDTKPGDADFRGLSDSIMIISIDATHNDIKIISILRDSLVRVEGYGHQKINAAYNLGGASLAIKTLNQTFDLNITEYATVDFVGMADIIEAVGGIEAELTEAEVRDANIHIRSMHRQRGTAEDYLSKPGKQKLNGVQAVAFSRVRKVATINGTNNNPGRTERQQLVMKQLFEKALSMKIAEYPKMIKALLPYMETSLDYADIFRLAGILVNDDLAFKQARMPADKVMIKYGMQVKGLGSCCYYNLEYAAKQMNAFIFEDISFEQYMEENGVDYTHWFYGQLADSNEEEPEEDEEIIEPDTELPEEGTDLPTEENPVVPEDPSLENSNPDTPADQEPTDPEQTPPEQTPPEQTPPEQTDPVGPIPPADPVIPPEQTPAT